MENASSMKSMTKKNTSDCSSNILENLLTVELLNMQNNIKDAIKDKFLCPQRFAQDIEYIVKTSKITYIDAIITYCEEKNIEIETVPKVNFQTTKRKNLSAKQFNSTS